MVPETPPCLEMCEFLFWGQGAMGAGAGATNVSKRGMGVSREVLSDFFESELFCTAAHWGKTVLCKLL